MRVILLWIGVFFIPVLAGEKEIVIDLHTQIAYALENGNIVFEGKISSGKEGRETPEGEYRILQKDRHHRSNLWPKPNGGAKMPYMLRITQDGIALHMGNVSKRAASHGCIRMEKILAKKMYQWARVGTIVHIDGNAHHYNHFSSSAYSDEYEVIE